MLLFYFIPTRTIPVKRYKPFIFILLLPFLWSCQKEVPHINASSRWQISENIVVDGKLSSNGKFASLLFSNNSIELWNNQHQQKVSVWQNEQLVADTVLLDLSETAEFILSANDKVIQVWHAESPEALGMINLSKHLGDAKITQIRFWEAPYRFIIGSNNGNVIFADTQNNDYRVNQQHSSDVTKFVLSKDRRTLFSGGNDGLVVKWDLKSFLPIISKRLPHRIVSLTVASNNHVFMSDALKDHIIWDSEKDTETGKVTHWKRFKWFRHGIFDPKLRWLITTSPKTDITLWGLSDLSILSSWQIEAQNMGSTVEDIAIIDNGKLRTLSTDGVLQDWDLSTFDL